jgi:hypothetical protein
MQDLSRQSLNEIREPTSDCHDKQDTAMRKFMNGTRQPTGKMGFILCSAAIMALTGCTTYVEQPARTVYVPQPLPEQPAPSPAYVAPPPEAPVVVIRAENDFYEPLSPYGEWVVVPSYGRCWRPRQVDLAWHPYSAGHWQRTEAGWYWASDEPWGWATYHYGRWDLDARFGWIWVPQTQWAPAWVSWREGGGYVGWAPLPPAARIGSSGEVEVRETAFVPRAFVFVEERRLLEPVRPTTVVVNDNTIINKTVNITKIKVVNKTVVNEGPRTDVIERTSGRKIEAVTTHELRHKEEAEVATRQRNNPGANERKAQPAARVEPAPARTVPARDIRAAEKPAERTSPPPVPAPAPSATKSRIPETGGQKPTANPARPEAEKASRNEKKQAVEAEKVKPEAAPAEPKTKQEIKSETSRSAGTKKGAQKQLEAQPKPAKEKAGETGGSDAKKKDQKKKGEPPETPAPPPGSPQRTPQ